MTDVPLAEDLVELHEEAQKRVDRVVLARIELAAALADLVAGREEIFAESAKAVKFIDDYLNPVVPNPEPIAPEVAIELPPEVEIPVFTTVDDEGLAFDNTSGGEVDIAPEVLVEEFGEFIEAPPVEDTFVPADSGVT
jgi:hypothetical protein